MKKFLKNEFIMYVGCAIITTIVNVSIYMLTYNFLIHSILVSNCLAYAVSIVLSFKINKKVVFKSKSRKVGREFIGFLLVRLLSFVIDSCVLFVCHNWIGISNFWSKMIANCSTTLNNYGLNKKVIFRKKEDI